MGEKQLEYYSIESYLNVEETTGIKHEYEDGRIFALAGGTLNHSRICRNISVSLFNETKDSNCEAFNTEAKVFIASANSFVYPDASVVCGEVEMHEKDQNAIANPVLIVEVLSKSTAKNDRATKFIKYRTLPSFKEYVLIHQNSPIVETYYKLESNHWEISTFMGLQSRMELKSINAKIPLKDIYQDVTQLEKPPL